MKSIQKIIAFQKFNKSIEDVSEIKIIYTIQTQHTEGIYSICELKDKRLVFPLTLKQTFCKSFPFEIFLDLYTYKSKRTCLFHGLA